jgi:hypothetical protein
MVTPPHRIDRYYIARRNSEESVKQGTDWSDG